MPDFACPLCQRPFSVSAEPASKRVRCPHCQQAVTLPASGPRWYLARNKKKLGPYTWQQLCALAQKGTLRPDDMVLQEGSTKWVRAAIVEGLFPPTTPPPSRRLPVIVGLASALLLTLVTLGALVAYSILRTPATIEPPVPKKDAVVEAPRKDPDRVVEPPTKKPEPPLEVKPIVEKKEPVPPKKETSPAVWDEPFLARLNQHRHAAGLGSVRLDATLSPGCAAHARYLARHFDPQADTQDEHPGKAGFSADGQAAARVALVAFAAPDQALDRWMGRLLDRAALLNPDLRSLGVGFAQTSSDGWVCVVDAVRGRGEPIVAYPAPKQTEVPLSFSGGPEVPDAGAVGGFPITLTFPPAMQVADATLDVHDAAGNNVTGWTWTPTKPAARHTGRNTIALIPRGMLLSHHVYEVKASAQVDGKPWTLAWSFTTEDDQDTQGIWAKKALARVNAYRARAKLAPVTLDATLSRGCSAHARYLVLNADHPAVQGLGAHDEDLKLPGASHEGQKAGKASNIAMGDYEPLDGIDAWMATLYHRVPMLEPNLKRIGFGCARSPRFGWTTVLNVSTGREAGERPQALFYPVPDQTNVPLSFPNGGEEPNPIPSSKSGRAGYPITAIFSRQEPLQKATGKLTDAAGDEVPCWVSSPENPANPMYPRHQDTAVCLIPKEPLDVNTTYHVHIKGELVGQPWEQRWKFTTIASGLTSAQAARQAIDRLNRARMQAGLTAVALDDKLSQGCQRHAEYLVRNTDEIARRKASVNDEDPLLPGFTAEGLRAAKQSDVFTNAPVPVTQIDDLMATSTRRVLLLDPTLQRVGFGCAHDIGRGWRCVLDLQGGKGDPRVILYPAPKQAGVPCVGSDPIDGVKTPGFPISVHFPAQSQPRQVQAVLTDAAGKNVEVRVSTHASTIALQPLLPLRPTHRYSVTVSAIVNAVEWRQTWQFTTAPSSFSAR